MSISASAVLSAAQRHAARLVAIRRTIHANPELAYEEYETSALVKSVLSELCIEHRGAAGTGVIADLRGSSSGGRTVALRADMDCLPIQEETGLEFASRNPGKMHACGHDAHTAMALGAAMILSEFRDLLPGGIRFIFQPSEEKLPGGAPAMIEAGALDGVDAIFGQHVMPMSPAGQMHFRAGMMMASTDELYITMRGRSGHGAVPHLAVDPIVASAELVLALQKIVSRTLDPFAPGVVTIAHIEGGSTTNIIPESVRMEGTMRAMDETWRSQAHGKIEEIVRGIALANGATYDLEIRHGYPALRNDEAATHVAENAARELLGSDAVLTADPLMTAEDFAYYLQKIPGSFWWIGAGTAEEGCTAGLHNCHFTINESILPIGSAMMAWAALRWLSVEQ